MSHAIRTAELTSYYWPLSGDKEKVVKVWVLLKHTTTPICIHNLRVAVCSRLKKVEGRYSFDSYILLNNLFLRMQIMSLFRTCKVLQSKQRPGKEMIQFNCYIGLAPHMVVTFMDG